MVPTCKELTWRGHSIQPPAPLILPKDSSLQFKQLPKGKAATFPVSGRLRKRLGAQVRGRGRMAWTRSILGEGWTQAYFPYLETWSNDAEPPYGNAK